MSDDHRCGCDNLGELAFADDFGEGDELDLVLDDPEPDPMPPRGRLTALGALEMVGAELFALDEHDGEVGYLKEAMGAGKALLDLVRGPAKSKAKSAERKAKAAQQKAAALEDELEEARKREERQKRQQEVVEERRREQTHAQQRRDLEKQIKELEDQKVLVNREMGRKAAEARRLEQKAAEEKQRQSRNRNLAIGGGVAATSLLALWAFNRRPKPRDDDERKERRR